jgi:myo-inositol-1(or 4)-monophosphatase
VAARRSLTDAVVVTGIPHRGRVGHGAFLSECRKVMSAVSGVRRFGSAALDLAWVAGGRFDLFWERGIQPWDMAAGILIVREAGGIVTDVDGGQNMLTTGSVMAGNPELHGALYELLGADQ